MLRHGSRFCFFVASNPPRSPGGGVEQPRRIAELEAPRQTSAIGARCSTGFLVDVAKAPPGFAELMPEARPVRHIRRTLSERESAQNGSLRSEPHGPSRRSPPLTGGNPRPRTAAFPTQKRVWQGPSQEHASLSRCRVLGALVKNLNPRRLKIPQKTAAFRLSGPEGQFSLGASACSCAQDIPVGRLIAYQLVRDRSGGG